MECYLLGETIEAQESSPLKERDDAVVIRPLIYDTILKRAETRMLTLAELQALYAELSQLLAETAYDTASRRNCLGSLENTTREINARFGSQWKLSVGP